MGGFQIFYNSLQGKLFGFLLCAMLLCYSYITSMNRISLLLHSDIQLSVGGFDVCFGVQFAHIRLVWINLFVGNDDQC